jgi:hypothetical protein
LLAPPTNAAIDREIENLPKVTIRSDRIPYELAPGRFLAAMVKRVLDATPVNMHEDARNRRRAVAAYESGSVP